MIVTAKHRLAADPIAVVTEDRGPERTRQEANRIGAERRDGRERSIARGKEDLVEHERRRRAVDEKVVPLHRRADDARPDDPSQADPCVRNDVDVDVIGNGHLSLQ